MNFDGYTFSPAPFSHSSFIARNVDSQNAKNAVIENRMQRVPPNKAVKAVAPKPLNKKILAKLATVPDKEIKGRAKWVEGMNAKTAFNGYVKVIKKNIIVAVKVENGRMDFDGVRYAVSKDGKYVINKEFLLVGVVGDGRILHKPTAAELKTFSQYGVKA